MEYVTPNNIICPLCYNHKIFLKNQEYSLICGICGNILKAHQQEYIIFSDGRKILNFNKEYRKGKKLYKFGVSETTGTGIKK